jgi:hypothetical protein
MFRRRLRGQRSLKDRLEGARDAGFTVRTDSSGATEVSRNDCAAVLSSVSGGPPRIERLGIIDGGAMLSLVDNGYIKTFRCPGSAPRPAIAADLERLHAFREDLGAALGIGSLFNESLGTVCDRHEYDRLSGR